MPSARSIVGVAGVRIWLSLVLLATVSACGKDEPKPAAVQEAVAPRAAPPPSALDLPAVATGDKVDLDALTPGFVRVPAGRLQLGSPPAEPGRGEDERLHAATIRRSFEMQATEVTAGDYERLIGRNPSLHEGCATCPVEQVSWFEAARYCNELSRRRGLPICTELDEKRPTWKGVDCRGFRLPTEAEWEHAAGGGADLATHGGRPGALEQVAWVDTNSGLQTHPVGEKEPNGYGLFDMLGNVAEWVWDWQDPYPDDAGVDPQGPAGGDNKVFRGGAARWSADEARVAFRNAYGPGNKVEFIGFRCVRTLSR